MKSPNTKDSKDQGIQIRLKTRAVLLGVAALFSIIGSLGSDSDMTSSKNHNQAIEQCDNNKIVNQSENKNLTEFVNTYNGMAGRVQEEYGVPKNVVLSMAILESDYGKSELATQANNFHGLKVNDEWNGDFYEKLTTEIVSYDALKNYTIAGQPKNLGNGTYEIYVSQKFEKFESPEEGFMGFGDYLHNRLNGEAYADAFINTDPDKFLKALFDDKGAKYATDPAYTQKIETILQGISYNDCLSAKSSAPAEEYKEVSWENLSYPVRAQFGDKREEYEKSMANINETRPTQKGYNDFLSNTKDISNEVRQSPYFVSQLFPTNKSFTTATPRVTLHYTAWPEPAWSLDGMGFASSVYHNGINNGAWGAANMYLSKDGRTLYLITGPDQVANHAGTQYSTTTIGVETPALVQSDISPEQYEGLVYTAARQWQKEYGDKKPSYNDMKLFVVGHGEITELTEAGGDHRDMPRPISDAISHLAYELLNK